MNQIHLSPGDDHLTKLEETVQQMAQQVAALGTCRLDAASSSGCFMCGRPGYLAKNCRYIAPHEIECFHCEKRGHIVRQCQSPGNGRGGGGGTPIATEYSSIREHTSNCISYKHRKSSIHRGPPESGNAARLRSIVLCNTPGLCSIS